MLGHNGGRLWIHTSYPAAAKASKRFDLPVWLVEGVKDALAPGLVLYFSKGEDRFLLRQRYVSRRLAADVVPRHGDQEKECTFLEKPFGIEVLAENMRESL